MTTIKPYTDLEQAKVLADILPIESADMCYIQDLLAYCMYGEYKPYIGDSFPAYGQDKIRYWSLAALLGVLPSAILDSSDAHYYRIHCMERYTEWYNNAVDACYEMILKLNELNLL